jgi:predicted Zn-dependent protease with MMP-like domain
MLPPIPARPDTEPHDDELAWSMHSALEAPDTGHDEEVLDVAIPEFEALVDEALDTIPRALRSAMQNVAIFIEDESPADGPVLLGLYEGIPLTDRDQWYIGVQPDRITIYRLPILRICHTREEVVTEVRTTVVHEIAHHFGISDERLDELGY